MTREARNCATLAGIAMTVVIALAGCAAGPDLNPDATGGREAGLTISEVSLQGTGTAATVGPGDTVKAAFTYHIWSPDGCPACFDQIVIGVGNDAQVCAYDGMPRVHPGTTKTDTITLIAPASAGSYPVRYKRTDDFTCEQALASYRTAPPPASQTIGTLIVSASAAAPPAETPKAEAEEQEAAPEETAAPPPAQPAPPVVTPVKPGRMMTVVIYFPNFKKDPKRRCRRVYPVRRTVPHSIMIATASLHELFAGPTEQEREAGYHSVFSPASADLLKGIKIENKTAYVNLKDFRTTLSDVSTTCAGLSFLAQMDWTLKRFRTVERTVYAIEGKPKDFYTFLGRGCGGTRCDEKPFRDINYPSGACN